MQKNRTQTQEPLVTLSIEELASRQGVEPVTNFESLLGHPSPEDESPDEFAAMLREWRRESAIESPRR